MEHILHVTGMEKYLFSSEKKPYPDKTFHTSRITMQKHQLINAHAMRYNADNFHCAKKRERTEISVAGKKMYCTISNGQRVKKKGKGMLLYKCSIKSIVNCSNHFKRHLLETCLFQQLDFSGKHSVTLQKYCAKAIHSHFHHCARK